MFALLHLVAVGLCVEGGRAPLHRQGIDSTVGRHSVGTPVRHQAAGFGEGSTASPGAEAVGMRGLRPMVDRAKEGMKVSSVVVVMDEAAVPLAGHVAGANIGNS